MLNYRKGVSMKFLTRFPGLSHIAIAASYIAGAIMKQEAEAAGAVHRTVPTPLMAANMPFNPSYPLRGRHGCNKRGGPSKRGRGLNYWRR